MAQTAHIVYTLDWHRGDEGTGPDWTLPELADNLRNWGLRDKVVLLVGRTEQLAPLFAPALFDLAFLDGAHDYQSVHRDLVFILHCLRPAGVVALHDWDQAEVRQAAHDVLGPGEYEQAGLLAWRTLSPRPCN
jgi:hypothetical protein